LHFRGEIAEINIGGNTFSNLYQGYGTILVPITVDDTPLIGFILGDDHLLLNLVLFDQFNNPILHIKNNQLYYLHEPWDIQLTGTRLIVREAHRKILIEIEFQPPSHVVVKRGRFLRNGVEILVRPDNILITNNATVLRQCSAINVPGGLIIGHHNKALPGFMKIDNVPRYLGDRSAALRFEKECFA
jgi:hypothetical protein